MPVESVSNQVLSQKSQLPRRTRGETLATQATLIVLYQKERILIAKNSLISMLAYLLGDVLLLTECPCMTSVD